MGIAGSTFLPQAPYSLLPRRRGDRQAQIPAVPCRTLPVMIIAYPSLMEKKAQQIPGNKVGNLGHLKDCTEDVRAWWSS